MVIGLIFGGVWRWGGAAELLPALAADAGGKSMQVQAKLRGLDLTGSSRI